MRIATFGLVLLTALALPESFNSIDVYDINKSGPRTFKYEESVNLFNLSLPCGPVKVVMKGNNSATVLYGRMNPSCDPDLVTYKKCEQDGTSDLFNCPDEPTAFILVQTKNQVKEIKTSYKPMKMETEEYLMKDFKEDTEHRKAILSKITSGGINKLHNYGNTGFLRIYGSNVIPLSTNPLNRFEAVAAVSEVSKGHILWFARPQYVLYLEIDGSPMSPLRANILSVCDCGANRFQRVRKSSFSSLSMSKEVALYWSPFHDRLGAKRVESLRNFVLKGGCLIIGFDTWIYNVYISPYHNSELKPLFVDGGIWPGNYNPNVFSSSTPFDLGGQDAMAAQHSDPENYIIRALATGLSEDCAKFANGLVKVPFGNEFGDRIKAVYRRLLHRHRYHMEWLTPCSGAAVKEPKRRQQLLCLSSLLAAPLFTSLTKIQVPGAPIVFPGPVPPQASRKTFKLRFTEARAKEEVVPTGLYLAPGESADVLVLSGNPDGWAVATMWQAYDLSPKKEAYIRWPSVKRVTKLDKTHTSFFSSFGGLLWFLSPKNSSTILEVQVSNVVEAPFFDRNIKWTQGQKDWNRQRVETKAPWGHLGGSFIVLVAPSGALRDLDQPQLTTDKYDRCVRAQRWLSGIEDIKRHREVIAVDAQINVGYMHAGYPSMGPLSLVQDSANFLKEGTRNKDWGPFHELGHNLQKGGWTKREYEDVTNNILTVICDQFINQRSPWAVTNSWLESKLEDVKKYVQGDKTKDGFFPRLGVYMHFQSVFGWLGLRRTFRTYVTNSRKAPKTNQAKFDTWYLRSSNVTGMDLAPFYLFWFWPISHEAQASMAHLPAFLPDDFTTRWAPQRVELLKARFGDRLTRVPTVLKPKGIKEDIDQQTSLIRVPYLLEITSM